MSWKFMWSNVVADGATNYVELLCQCDADVCRNVTA